MYGTLVNNEYLIINMIGKGAYSNVWLAYHISQKDFVAIKVIHEEDEDVAVREIEVNKGFKDSKNLNTLIDSFTYNIEDVCYYCLVFPLLAGTLYDLRQSNEIPDYILEKIFLKVTKMLKELHENYKLIHGDVKPENLAFKGVNPISKNIIERFHTLGGLDLYLEKYHDLQLSCDKLIEDLLTEEDMNSDKFSVHNSSNDSSYSECDSVEESTETSVESESESQVSVESESETDTESSYESCNTEYCESDSISEITIEEYEYKVDDEFWKNFEFFLIDYSHVHTVDEDLYYEPTRYYRCIKTLKKEKAGYYKDWYALACTMYELEHGSVFVNPTSDDKDAEQIAYITENIGKLKKWLVIKDIKDS